MSRRERVLMVLGFVGAIGLVVYPLAHRLSTERGSASAARPASPARPSASTTATPAIRSTTPTPFEPTARPIDAFWAAEAVGHRGANGETFDYVCSQGGTFGHIWGTDMYTDDSSVCTAAVHRGAITRERGGWVRIIIRPPLTDYLGTERNGVDTESFGSWEGSYEVVVP